jgi:hypothetical protein
LARVPDRCGRARVIGHVVTRFGEPVTTPKAPARDDMVVAEFALNSPVSAQVAGFLLKPPELTAYVATLGSRSTERFRFIPGTSDDAHVLAAPRQLGYAPAFSPPALDWIELSGGGWARGQGEVSVTFLAVPMARSAPVP